MLQGKWRMWMEHNGQQIQYWFDFDARTGMVARVVGGEIVERTRLTSLEGQRETGNSWRVFFALGMRGTFYYLGFAEAGARSGRFMSLQLPGDRDWGMFKMAEGWEEEAKKSTMRKVQRTRGNQVVRKEQDEAGREWVSWRSKGGKWREKGIALPGRGGAERRGTVCGE